jgi:hypothetical protein
VKPYVFKTSVVNGFRYRVEQAVADVRPRDIRHARAHANVQELANSEILMVSSFSFSFLFIL